MPTNTARMMSSHLRWRPEGLGVPGVFIVGVSLLAAAAALINSVPKCRHSRGAERVQVA